MLKRCFIQSFVILVMIALLGVIGVVCANAQGVLSPKLLRQDGAADQDRLCWSDSNGYWGPCSASGTGVTTLNGLTGATQTFADVDDTNVTVAIASTGTTHTWTLGWSGVLGLSRGGTGADLSATGGANQFVRQNSAGGVLSVGSIADADVPDNITISLAATATALAANPNDCSAGQYATAIAANGDLTCAQVAWSQIGSTTDVIGTAQLDDDADTPGSGDYVRVDTVDQAGFEYRTTAEVLSDIGAAASAHTHGASTIDEDAIGTSELDDDANTPAAGSFVVVETGAASFDYVAANAGTDITADLEEETHATEHAENAADELLVENLGTACTIGQIVESDGSGGLDCADPSSGGVSTSRTAYASLPATCTTGDLWFNADTSSKYTAYCSATNTWSFYWGSEAVTLPPATGWTQENFETGDDDDFTNGSLFLNAERTAVGELTGVYRTAPSAPYTVDFVFSMEASGVTNASTNNGGRDARCGPAFRDGADKIVLFSVGASGNSNGAFVEYWTDDQTFSSAPTSESDNAGGLMYQFTTQDLYHFRIEDDNTNLKFYIGKHLDKLKQFGSSLGRTAFLASGPTLYGFYCYKGDSDGIAEVVSLEEN